MRELMLRRFGIELENRYPYTVSDYDIEQALNVALGASKARRWRISCDGGEDGWEVRTPPSTWRNWNDVRVATRTLRELGGRYSEEAGMHVHLENDEMSPETLLRWVLLWYVLEDGLFALVHRSRWHNHWCSALRRTFPWDALRATLIEGRAFSNQWGRMNPDEFVRQIGRRALNPVSCHGTSEIRLHHSSLDPVKQRGWLLLMQVLMWHATQEKNSTKFVELYDEPREVKIQTMMKLVKDYLSPNLGDWLARHLAWRANHYSSLAVAAA